MKQRGDVVLRIGAEGGEIAIARYFTSGGRWAYRPSTDESTLSEMLGELEDGGDSMAEKPVSDTEEPPSTFEDALRAIGRFPWPLLTPIVVHPDYRERVLSAARWHPEGGEDALEQWERRLRRIDDREAELELLSPYEAALRIASVVHAHKVRKGTRIPYVSHVVAVSRLLDHAGLPEPVVLAGLLHDVLEDAKDDKEGLTRLELHDTFPDFEAPPAIEGLRQGLVALMDRHVGPETRWLVQCVTEKKEDGGQERPWKARKLEALHHLARADARVLALKAADTLHNVLAILADSRATAGAVFSRFNASADDLVWYYGTAAAIVFEHLGEQNVLAREVQSAVQRLASEVERALGVRDPFTGRREHRADGPADTTIVVNGPRRHRIHSLDQWLTSAPPARGHLHWKDGRSAKELARAWIGDVPLEPRVPASLQVLLDSNPGTAGVTFASAYPEHETSLDDLGKGRQHDLVAMGVAGGRRLLVAVEAKADEPFGELIADVIEGADRTNAQAATGAGRATGRRARVEALCRQVFGRELDAEIGKLRYQLLHAVAGTINEARERGAEQTCFVVHEFTSGSTDPKKLERNAADLDAFVRALGGNSDAALTPGTSVGPFRLPHAGTIGIDILMGKCRTDILQK